MTQSDFHFEVVPSSSSDSLEGALGKEKMMRKGDDDITFFCDAAQSTRVSRRLICLTKAALLHFYFFWRKENGRWNKRRLEKVKPGILPGCVCGV